MAATNPVYTHADGYPTGFSRGISTTAGAEFDLVAGAFDVFHGYAVDTGSANAMVVTVPASLALLGLYDGLRLWVKAANTVTGATTIAPGALGTIALKRVDATALSNEIVAGQIFECVYSSAMSAFQLVSNGLPSAANGLPLSGGTISGNLTVTGTGLVSGVFTANAISSQQVTITGGNKRVVNSYGDSAITWSASGQNATITLSAGATDALTIGLSAAVTAKGALTVTTGFGCNGATPRVAAASGGALATYGAGANGFDTAGNASALYAMVVAVRAALVANGIMS